VSRGAWFLAVLLTLPALTVPAPAWGADSAAHANDAVVVVYGDVVVHPGETVKGVYVVHGDARISGRVDGDVVVVSGNVLLSGTVEGDLIAVSGRATLLPSAEVTGDLRYADERPAIAPGAHVRGSLEKDSWPDFNGAFSWLGAFLFWLAMTISAAILGALLVLIAPRAADAVAARSREKPGPVIAIGIAIAIVLPVLAVLAAVTLVGLPLAIVVALALLPLGLVAYLASAFALGRAILKPPGERLLALLVGLGILRGAALVPFLGILVGLAAMVFGLGLIGAAIGAARNPAEPEPARTPGS
jgi:hypothetical protein